MQRKPALSISHVYACGKLFNQKPNRIHGRIDITSKMQRKKSFYICCGNSRRVAFQQKIQKTWRLVVCTGNVEWKLAGMISVLENIGVLGRQVFGSGVWKTRPPTTSTACRMERSPSLRVCNLQTFPVLLD